MTLLILGLTILGGTVPIEGKPILLIDLADPASYQLGADEWHDLANPERIGKLEGFLGQPNRGWVGDGSTDHPFALRFSGSPGNCVAFADAFPVSGNDLTIECWHRANRGTIIGQYRRQGTKRRMSLTKGGRQDGFYAGVYGHTTASTTDEYPPPDQWVQLVFTRNSQDGKQRFYINADEQHLWRNDTATRFAGAGAWFLGAMAPETAERDWLSGDIAIVRIYSRQLSSAEVRQNFDQNAARFGIATSTDERPGFVEKDLVLHLDAENKRSNPGILQSLTNLTNRKPAGWLGADSKVDKQDPKFFRQPSPHLTFEPGERDLVTLQPLSATKPFSASLFVKKGKLAGERILAEQRGQWRIGFNGERSLSPAFQLCGQDGRWRVLKGTVVSATTELASGWMQVTVVYEPGKRMELWINGNRNVELTDDMPEVLADSDAPLLLGGDGADGTEHYFDGSIALVRIDDEALSGEQIEGQFEEYRDRFGLDLERPRYEDVQPLSGGSFPPRTDVVDVVEKTNAILLTWYGRDKRCRRLVIDRQNHPGLIRGLWIDRDRSGAFDADTENLLPVAKLDWWIRTAEHEHHLDYDDAQWQVAGENGRAMLKVSKLRMGPIRATMRLQLLAGSNLFRCELETHGADSEIAVEQLGVASRWMRTGDNNPMREFARYELDTAIQGRDVPQVVRNSLDGANSPALDGRVQRAYYKAACLAGPVGSIVIEPPPHLGWYHCDPFYIDRPGPYADAGIIHFDYAHHLQTEKLRFAEGDHRRFITLWHVQSGDAAEALKATYSYQNHHRYPQLPGYKVLMTHCHTKENGLPYFRSAGVNFCGVCDNNDPDYFQDDRFAEAAKKHVDLADPRSDVTDPRWTENVKRKSAFSTPEFLVCPGVEVATGNQYSGQDQGKINSHMCYLGPRPDSYYVGRHLGNAEPMARKVDSVGGVAWLAHPRFDTSFLRLHYEPKLLGLAVNSIAMSSYPRTAYLFRDEIVQSMWLRQVDGLWNADFRPWIIGEFDAQGFPGYTHASRHGNRIYPEGLVNYVRLDKTDLKELIVKLRAGDFFVTTGEILLRDATLDGVRFGGELAGAAGRKELKLSLRWTYPLKEIRLISNRGREDRLPPNGDFGEQMATFPVDTTGLRWLRVEVHDVANNYCLSQPIRILAKP